VSAGYLVSVDAYMNLQLANTEEFIEGQFTGNLGEVLIRQVSCLPKSSQFRAANDLDVDPCYHNCIQMFNGLALVCSGCCHDCFFKNIWPCRCNNVLYMRGVPEGDEDGEAKAMES